MRRSHFLLAWSVPAFILIYFWLRPEADLLVQVPLFHFYIVTLTSFAATIVSFLLIAALGPVAQPRHVLVAVAFAVMGSFFIVHGLTTPGAIIAPSNPAVPAVGWSAWLTLFSGGVIFAVAGLDRPQGLSRAFLLRFIIAVAVAVMIFVSVVVAVPQWLQVVEEGAAPWHRRLLFLATMVMWLFATVQLWQTWRRSSSVLDGSLVLVSGWMVLGSISLHLFPVWNLSWWTYHFLLLVGFLITAYVLFMAYEQAREFRLVRYYLASSLILTALLALVASYLFTQFSQHILSQEIEQSLGQVMESFAGDVAGDLPANASSQEIQVAFTNRLDALPVDAAGIFDVEGKPLSGGELSEVGNQNYGSGELWQRILGGENVVYVREPGGGSSYGGAPSSVHTVHGYIAVDGSSGPIGVLVATSEVPHLTESVMRARSIGLLIAALTMGVLFAGLMVVVQRAGGIIRARNEELAGAYRDLREAEGMRDDLSNMIVHDLRTPLTAILTSVGMLNQLLENEAVDFPARVVERTKRAAERLDRMIDDILTVGKIESGELTPAREDVHVAQLLEERLDPFFLQARAEEKTLTLDCPPELSVSLDPELTGRVLDNLVNNAFKYTTRGGCVTVSAQGQNGVVTLSVRDDGTGVPDNYKEVIFRKFSQIREERGSAVRKGTGLGLAFCRLVVEAHGGRIWVEDSAEGGSEFKIRLPHEV